MAVELATAYVSIVPSAKGIKGKLRDQLGAPAASAGQGAGEAAGKGFVSRFASRITSGISTTVKRSFQASMAGVAAAGSIALVKGFGRLTSLENAEKRLSSMGLTANESAGLMKSLNSTLEGTPYALNDGAEALARLVSSGADLDRIPSLMSSITDAAAFGQAPLGEVANIFSRIATNGKLSALEMEMLQDRGIPALNLLADAAGVSAEEFRKMVSGNEIDAERFFDLWEEGAKGFGENNITMAGAAKSAGDTVSGSWGNLLTAMARAGATILAPVFDHLAGLFTSLSGYMDDVGKAVGPMVESFASSGVVADVWRTISDVVGDVASRLASIDWGAVFASLGDIVAPLVPKLVALGDALGGAITEAVETLGPAFAKLAPWVADVAVSFAGQFADGLRLVAPVIPIVADLVSHLVDLVTKVPPGVLQALGVALGGPLLAVKGYGAAASGVGKLTSSVKGLIGQYKTFGSGVAKAVSGVAGWTKAMATATATAAKNAAATAAAKVKQLALAAAQKVAAAAQWILNAAMSANPITLVVIAIAALVAALVLAYNKVGWFRDLVDAAWRGIRSATEVAFNAVRTVITTVFNVVRTIITTYVNAYLTVIRTAFNAIRTVVTTVLNVVRSAVTVAFTVIKTVITTYVNAYLTVIRTVFNAIKTTITTVLNAVKSVVSSAVNAVRSTITSVFTSVRSTVSSVWGGIRSTISDAVGRIRSAVSSGFAAVKSLIINPITEAKNTVSNLIGDIVGAFSGIPGKIGSAMSGLAGAIKGPFESALGSIKTLWNSTVGKVSFSIPSWVPGVGGKGWSFPKMHTGGVVPGGVGDEHPYILQGGEVVLSREQVRAFRVAQPAPAPAASGRGGPVVEFGDVHLHDAVDVDALSRRMAFAVGGAL